MNITLIGSGNVATVLGRLLKDKEHAIVEICSRNKSHAATLAAELNAAICNSPKNINNQSDIYIIAVSDDAVSRVISSLSLGEKFVVHTCGSISKDVLKNTSKNYGVLYPLQSLRKETSYVPTIAFLVDGNNEHTMQEIKKLAASLSSQVAQANDEMRLHYHLSAVVVSNFTNHLYALTRQYCDANKIDFHLLLSLIEEVVQRLHHYEPAEMQTGPAVRGDETTIQKHLALLEKFPELQYVYEVMSKNIRDFNR